jgi:nicotinamide-nucleotide amidase
LCQIKIMKELNASIITIGDELLIGQTIDTNSAFIAQELNKIGIWVRKRIAVGDRKDDIVTALDEAAMYSKVVIITGGLGPTADDVTKPVLCEYFGSILRSDPGVEAHIRDIFQRRNATVSERNLKQAEVPDNCKVLFNQRGTAPGMWFEKNDLIFISLPGVPHEMKGLVEGAVIPALKQLPGLPAVIHLNLLTAGVGESVIADHLQNFEASLPQHIKMAYLPSYGHVKLRLTARGENEAVIQEEIRLYFDRLKTEVKEWLVTDTDLPLQDVLSQMLIHLKKTVSTAESCTGGYIAHLITSKAGSSAIFLGSVVAYSNEIKINLLDVDQNIIVENGAVSEPTVRAMVSGILKRSGSDYAIATSGIMGPGGGTEEKPVGTVWIAAGSREKLLAKKLFFRFDRKRNIEMTAQAALNLLRILVLDQEQKPD